MRAVRVKEETGESVCIEEETPQLQPAEPGPLHLLEEAFELTCSAVAQASPGVRHSPARDREAKHSGSGIRIPHPCPDCGKRFVELGPLKRHRRTHARKTPYPCAECGKRFSQKGALQDHLRIHTGERPFHCGECGRSFTRVDGLRIHQRIHTGEKPYRCGQCGRSFRHSAGLKQHSQTHTPRGQGEASVECHRDQY
ncbi:gastrula zinc finger protein XlCGF7.1-like [Acipenser ruthenus]|uniref:gastrula zinc finger protein XlCGF7.1-like n=1 Tax=Acipenser ruthenus TaxID=7906 RepID=UPI002740D981|nr:gastrula zinc finger protein XlCGF7.1-like [Acipenser ruthenus]XP_058873839.1 gastrula zinc finger protein XlCGF7.1-like [Acipenser ruthenus]